MHKLAKGLKKKKKGKKSKHKEEELFKPEELEAYRREHAAANEEGTSAKNEEWRNFLTLTSGVDDILKKTQDDLDRIKSTSFFQRVPPPSEVQARKALEQAQNQVQEEGKETVLEFKQKEDQQLGIVQVSESESEEEEEDDIFDTAYIDAIATGEVKLAYIPESPTDKDTNDPFDTSIAERAILGPAVERKGKKLVPLGAAVEVLTGRAQLPTCATKPISSRRQIFKQKDLLLSSFDKNSTPSESCNEHVESEEPIKTLLDDDEIPLPDEPIDLSKTLYVPPSQPTEISPVEGKTQDVVKEFEDEDDKEFEALAAESLSKKPINNGSTVVLPAPSAVVVDKVEDWKPFDEERINTKNEFDLTHEDDPFDTTFAENILPGKAELKLIEREILENDDNFDPRALDSKENFIKDRVPESSLNLITPVHRDLLGGSTSDLSKLGDQPILPTEEATVEIKYCDPFDTSIVDAATVPGQAELKHLERELLGDIQYTPRVKTHKTISVDDDNFNPRDLESQQSKPRTLSRPDVLNVGHNKVVSFLVPKNQQDLLDTDTESSKVAKPLTPFYVRKKSVPQEESPDSTNGDQDPFDTSFLPSFAPGKAELKVIESELINSQVPQNFILEDQDFDPRDESKAAKVAAVEKIKDIVRAKPAELPIQPEPVDLLSVSSNDISVKVLTPAAEIKEKLEDTLSYADPFDTSIAGNILPGKAELKLLENELIEPSPECLLREQNTDLLIHSGDTIIEKPLSPIQGQSLEEPQDDFDPFDTSFASNIQPGKAELKVLESELI